MIESKNAGGLPLQALQIFDRLPKIPGSGTNPNQEPDPVVGATLCYQREVGSKVYEMSDHLGNALSTVMKWRRMRVVFTDQREAVDNGGVLASNLAVVSFNDYYAFGMLQPGRTTSSDDYRYGFNGMEKESEWNSGNIYDYGFRIYDPRIGKFLSVDPLFQSYPWLSTYQFAQNDPIRNIDIDGLEGGSSVEYAFIGAGRDIERWYDKTSANMSQWYRSWKILPTNLPNAPAPPIHTGQDECAIELPTTETVCLELQDGTCNVDYFEHDEIERIEQDERDEPVSAIVLHRTAGSTQSSAVNWWKDENNPTESGTPFIIDKNGNITQTANLLNVTYHTQGGNVPVNGVDIYINNSNSIGIEIVGSWSEADGWDPLTQAQKDAILDLVTRLKNEYALDNDDVFYHYQIDSGKKEGEGEEAYDVVQDGG